ncbi:MAG: hypothetical protein KTR30_33520 [Saprospiraceae bacterium]|nr:hypothetical protein [Saprospiraceae bacterium]
MTLRNFLILNAILFVPFGLIMLILPGDLFPLFGIDLDADGILMARVFGSALLNLGLICYLVRAEPTDSSAMKAVLIGNFLFHAFDALSTFVASYTGVMNSLGWMFTSLHFVLAVGFLYFLRFQLFPKQVLG